MPPTSQLSSLDPPHTKSSSQQNVIVTGGGTGIGKGMTTALALNGAKVIICGRRQEAIDKTAAEINAAVKEAGSEGEVIAIQADVSSKQGVIAFYDKVVPIFDKVC